MSAEKQEKRIKEPPLMMVLPAMTVLEVL